MAGRTRRPPSNTRTVAVEHPARTAMCARVRSACRRISRARSGVMSNVMKPKISDPSPLEEPTSAVQTSGLGPVQLPSMLEVLRGAPEGEVVILRFRLDRRASVDANGKRDPYRCPPGAEPRTLSEESLNEALRVGVGERPRAHKAFQREILEPATARANNCLVVQRCCCDRFCALAVMHGSRVPIGQRAF